MRCNLPKTWIHDDLYGTLDPDKLNFSVDWCHGWVPCSNVLQFLDGLEKIDSRLSLVHFVRSHRSILNWMVRYDLPGTGIVIAWNPDPDAASDEESNFDPQYTAISKLVPGFNRGIFISFPGDGLRYLGDSVVKQVFQYLFDLDFHCTRLDLACDVLDPDYRPVIDCLIQSFEHAFSYSADDFTLRSRVPAAKFAKYITFFRELDPYRKDHPVSTNLSFGSTASKLGKFRCYDKWLELRSGRLSNQVSSDVNLLKFLDMHQFWYRLEYALSKRYAEPLFIQLMSGQSLSDLFVTAADAFFTPVVGASSGYQRCQLDPVDSWVLFLQDCGVRQNIHFVQLLFLGDTVDRSLNNIKKYSTTLVKYHILSQVHPEFFRASFADKVPKLFSDPDFKRWLSDLDLDYNYWSDNLRSSLSNPCQLTPTDPDLIDCDDRDINFSNIL